MSKPMDRRTFLKYSLAASVVVWVGEEIPSWLDIGQVDVKLGPTDKVSTPISGAS